MDITFVIAETLAHLSLNLIARSSVKQKKKSVKLEMMGFPNSLSRSYKKSW